MYSLIAFFDRVAGKQSKALLVTLLALAAIMIAPTASATSVQHYQNYHSSWKEALSEQLKNRQQLQVRDIQVKPATFDNLFGNGSDYQHRLFPQLSNFNWDRFKQIDWSQFSGKFDGRRNLLAGCFGAAGQLRGGEHCEKLNNFLEHVHTGGCHSSANAVPVPAAVWLFGSALAGLFGWRKRQAMKLAH